MKVRDILTITKKDLLLEFRSRETLNSMLLFALLALMLMSFGTGASDAVVRAVGATFLWMVIIFVGMIGVFRAFTSEEERGTLDGLRLAPISAESILLGKIVYNFLLLFMVELIIFPLFIVMLDYPLEGSFLMGLLVLTLGVAGFAVVSTAISALILNARARELLFPVILLPIIFPLLSSAIHGLKTVLNGGGLLDVQKECVVITVYIILFLTISLLTFEYVIEAS
ncbi:MAG TPA: heme ABC transporter permease [Candidatus Syntrophoarchaeum butanivorans]|uniref:Heme exporter protein B n=3 Tax=Candidatus Syntropharchaeum butanivorans TaxID=1839936 RepID=A0A1F2P6H2_9EURY|nr:MAG: Cytochrome c-type biogenesis protein CcmB [Candidatus Syntrophoarchaeum butanivorans]HDM36564.1 heme ABC transporter permease [Candidatus Syntrophoarchaeum butanivorans]